VTGLVLAALVAIATLAAVRLGARVSLRRAAPVATALLLGLAGYAWQGSPALIGRPVEPGAQQIRFDEALAQKRRDMGERISRATKWMVVSDALARQGDTQDAANVLLAGLREHPDDANLWVGLGNALVAHADGTLSPAADHAYRRALALEPDGHSAQYFYGLALAESGQFEQARERWGRLAARLPEDHALRMELIRNIALLNALIRRRDELSRSGDPAP
jgi:cytochrome c-type biogenesis protein CcmH/NrfG